MLNLQVSEDEVIIKTHDMLSQIFMYDIELTRLQQQIKFQNDYQKRLSKEAVWLFSKKELSKLFSVIKKNLQELYYETETLPKDSKEWDEAMGCYKETVQDEAFYNLLYFSGISINELVMLPLNSFDPTTNKLSWKNSKKGILTEITINDKKILDLLKFHLEVNEPKKFLFEFYEKALPVEVAQSMFEEYCKMANIENEEKWVCETLQFTRILNVS